MNKEQVQQAIDVFLKVLVYEAQLNAFQRRLLHDIKDKVLRNFAEAELKKIKANIKNGRYIEINKTKRNECLRNKPKSKKSKSNLEKEVKVIELPVKQPKPKKSFEVYEPDSNLISLNFKMYTFQKLAAVLETDISTFQKMLSSHSTTGEFRPSAIINEQQWELLKKFVINKWKKKVVKLKEIELQTPSKRSNNYYSSPPLRKYVGGNFGKLIFVGKTN